MKRPHRRVLFALLILSALLPVPARASVPILVVDGRGFGHGVGMAQDGVFWMAKAGGSTEHILFHFYPGTSIGQASGNVRVPVLDAGAAPAAMIVSFPNGGEVRDSLSGNQSTGFPVAVPPGGQVRIGWDGRAYSVEGGTPNAPANASTAEWPAAESASDDDSIPAQVPGTSSTTTTSTSTSTTTTLLPGSSTTSSTTTTTAPPPPGPDEGPATATSGRPLWAVPAGGGTVTVPARGRTYRGVAEATAATGRLRLVNQVDVETYLKGMGEVRDPNWPAAGLRAQAIAARTYALRAMAVAGELCDTQRCQVYLGAHAEYGAMNRAVDDTRGQVLGYGRRLASAVYSANAGGHSASTEEGFGTPPDGYPYLKPTPYLTRNPLPWTVTVALRDVAARFGYPGAVTDVRVSARGPSGRATQITIDGTAGPQDVVGIAFDAALGLKSTLFDLRIDQAEVAPEAPEPEALIQAPPEAAGAVAAPPPASRGSRSVPDLPRAPRLSDDVIADRAAHREPWIPWALAASLIAAVAASGWAHLGTASRRSSVAGRVKGALRRVERPLR